MVRNGPQNRWKETGDGDQSRWAEGSQGWIDAKERCLMGGSVTGVWIRRKYKTHMA